jgi:hypothetical protein
LPLITFRSSVVVSETTADAECSSVGRHATVDDRQQASRANSTRGSSPVAGDGAIAHGHAPTQCADGLIVQAATVLFGDIVADGGAQQ